MENFTDYVIGDALIVIPMLFIIGNIIKNTPKIKDNTWTIPYILLVVGIVSTVAIMGFNVNAVIQGVLVSGAAVFGNELIKQAKKSE